ncbi:MAG: Wzz/FepE/Etk N-terminal domain-containing protein [Bacteroidia bacterium]|nr:Wzz/FepE/Etk N-terminal domain-containing protein [Bacteroidia bacterium]
MEKETQIPTPPPNSDPDEIDLLALAHTMWNGRKIILYSVLCGAILGIVIAISTPNEFTATTVMVPQSGDSQSRMGGLGGLAALAGISLDATPGADLSPMIYPQIVKSIPFQLELMNTPLNFQDYAKPITLFDYYTKYSKPTILGSIQKYTIGLPGLLISAIKGKPKELSLADGLVNQLILLTNDQYALKKALDGIVSLNVNAKEGYLTLTTQMSEPLIAAQLAQKAQNLLQNSITEFKIEKAKANLDFIQRRYNEIKAEFEKAQVSLALVTDRNKNFTSGLPRIELDRIQSKYTIAFSVFQELAKQLEQAKIQVKKDTPVFTIIEPVTVPSEKSKPNKPMILFIWLFFGGVIGTGIVFGKGFIEPLKKKWMEKV